MRSRLDTPGFCASSNRISRPVSVTAERILLAITLGSSSRSITPLWLGEDLLIFAVGSCRSWILARRLDDVRLRHDEGLAVAAVEALGQVAGELEVLALVLADRHLVGVVQQDVGRHEDRVGEQADGGALGAVTARLVLELGHPAGLAEAGDAREHPGQLRVLGHVALHEDRGPLGVDTAGEVLGGGTAGALAQPRGLDLDGDGVQVDDAVERVVGLLQPDPVDQRAEVVAEVQRVVRRLHARQDARLGGGWGVVVRGHARHCVRSATLVAPRVAPPRAGRGRRA